MTRIDTAKLSQGVDLIVEQISGVRSVGLTWLIPAGAAHDPNDKLGLATVTSEMLMRGSGDRDSRAFADACDMIGMNHSADAGTFFMKVSASFTGDRTLETLPLIVDLVRRPRFDEASLEPSRALCLQTLASLADEPHQRAIFAARERHYPEPINRSGLGTVEGLNAITIDDVRRNWSRRALPEGSILAVAGAVEFETIRDHFEELFSGWTGKGSLPTLGTSAPRGYSHLDDNSNQVQIVCVHEAPPAPHENNILEQAAVSVLSGGMSGRLFTEVREKRGLCYTVSASYRSDRDFGSVTGYVGTTQERAQESLDVLLAEFERLRSGVTEDEFQRALVGLKSRVVFSGESTGARASTLAQDQHKRGRPRSLDEIAAQLDAVTFQSLNAYLSTRAMGRVTTQTLGPTPLNPPMTDR